MAKFTRFSLLIVALICSLQLNAQNYPDLYVKGTFNNWQATEQGKLTRNGNTYSIHLDNLNGEFKIATADWYWDFGSPTADKYEISEPLWLNTTRGGGNLVANHLTDVLISFEYSDQLYVGGEGWIDVSFTINGVAPTDKPTPNPVEVKGLSGTLPVLYINVFDEAGNLNNEIISKDLDHKNYFTGVYWLDMNGCQWLEDLGGTNLGSKEEPLPLEIKARGNWTRRGFSKKPFKLKLGKKQSMLGMSKSKHYAILAHADDNKGYLRNFTGFDLGRRIGLPWTPSQQPVEVVINGDYRGLYFLTESIRIGDDRVMIEELADSATDPALISGGYLVELDNYDEPDDIQIRMEEKGQAPVAKDLLRVTFDTPEVYSDIMRRFVTDQFTTINDLIGENSDDLWRYMDIDDAARYYIVEEILSHTEAFHGSTYLFRDRGEGQKWHFSPIWDCGNAFNGPTDGFFYNNAMFGATWIPSLRLNNIFNDKVRQTWLWFMSNNFDGLYDDMEEYASRITAAAAADHKRWNNQPVPWGGQPVQDNTDMQSRLDEVTNHISNKVAWLKNQLGDYSAQRFLEPERDLTPAAPLPEYATSTVAVETLDSAELEGDCEFFNLQGMRVENPAAGEIYIVRTAKGTAKVIVR